MAVRPDAVGPPTNVATERPVARARAESSRAARARVSRHVVKLATARAALAVGREIETTSVAPRGAATTHAAGREIETTSVVAREIETTRVVARGAAMTNVLPAARVVRRTRATCAMAIGSSASRAGRVP